MERHGEEVDLTPTEARAGSTPHIVRWVLLISLVLAIILLSIVWMTGAATTDDAEAVTPVTNQATPAPTASGDNAVATQPTMSEAPINEAPVAVEEPLQDAAPSQ